MCISVYECSGLAQNHFGFSSSAGNSVGDASVLPIKLAFNTGTFSYFNAARLHIPSGLTFLSQK